MNSNQKPTVLVTGASRGIGKAIAIGFAKAGYNVIVNYLKNAQEANNVVDEIAQLGGESLALQADISNELSVQKMFARGVGHFGPIDVLINNAAMAGQNLFTDLTSAEWRRIFAVNVDGVFYCSQAVLPAMISKKTGKIINIASIWGLTGASCEVDYSATKGAVIALTKALAKEVGPSGIQVNCVAPGVIATDMNSELTTEDLKALANATPLGKIGQPEDIAEIVLFLASPAANFITGQVISPNGGFLI